MQELYQIPLKEFDYDFICDELVDPLVIPNGWSVSHRKFGNPTFVKGELEVDVWPISSHRYILNHHLPATIENLLEGTPFTVQSIVYDVKREVLIGNVGIQSILHRTFGVNNLEEARFLAQRKNTGVDALMKKTAETMGMTVVPCGE